MSLTSVSPIDGRYKEKTLELSPFVSEFALIRTRVEIETKYLIAVSKLGLLRLGPRERSKIQNLVKGFDLDEAEKVKEIEERVRHDVKAIEIYLRNELKPEVSEMIHFGLTSEDINNIAYRLMLRDGFFVAVLPYLQKLRNELKQLAKKHKNIPILARTHGQPAVPTTLGKEIMVFLTRLSSEIEKIERIRFTGKLNGAVGNYNALHFSYPKVNWLKFSRDFIQSFGFRPNLLTTQVNSNEDIIEFFQNIQRINGILIDLNQDLWRYISDGWLVLNSEKDQVGSSTMPQKINPIDFENSEGNLKMANGIIELFTRELPISRLQRDLSGSTILRNIGGVLAHSLLAYKNTLFGLSKITIDKNQILEDLNSDWSILSEALQTILRIEHVKDSYSKVLELTKGKKLDREDWLNLVEALQISGKNKQKLLNLTPSKYTGLASKLVK
ncbi:MAG TPA: adenylosuccinate lyase [Patescibacteria group bacterium]|nr:adenylosuccinate lyase [Patescibacteria group bacterium]